jgi:hypothetical protein
MHFVVLKKIPFGQGLLKDKRQGTLILVDVLPGRHKEKHNRGTSQVSRFLHSCVRVRQHMYNVILEFMNVENTEYCAVRSSV